MGYWRSILDTLKVLGRKGCKRHEAIGGTATWGEAHPTTPDHAHSWKASLE